MKWTMYDYKARRESGTAYEQIQDTNENWSFETAKQWVLHLPVARDVEGALEAILSDLARTGCEALTGDYHVDNSWVQWNEPEPLTEDEPLHLAVYFLADGVDEAHRIGHTLADRIGFHISQRCVSTAADWAEQTWRAHDSWNGESLLA